MGKALLVDLVDFTWTLKFDGSSTSNSSGAGIVLIREDGETKLSHLNLISHAPTMFQNMKLT